MTSASVTEARQLLATGRFVAVDVEQPERPTPDDQGVARQLGLDAERLAWLGRPAEGVRAEYDGEIAGFVVPVVEGDRVAHVHAVATKQYLGRGAPRAHGADRDPGRPGAARSAY